MIWGLGIIGNWKGTRELVKGSLGEGMGDLWEMERGSTWDVFLPTIYGSNSVFSSGDLMLLLGFVWVVISVAVPCQQPLKDLLQSL